MSQLSQLVKAKLPNQDEYSTNEQIENVIEAVFAVIEEQVEVNGSFTRQNFGTFKKHTREAHTGRNLKTGEPVEVPEKTRIKFKSSGAVNAKLSPIKNKE